MTKILQLAEKQAINEVNSFSLLDTLAQLDGKDKKNDVSRRANTL